MSQTEYLRGLAVAAAAVIVLALLLRLVSGHRWFGFYGWASVALLTLPVFAYHLWKRLPAAGRSRWWTLIFAVPVALLAIIQIVYWCVFFSIGPTNATPGIVREMVRINAGFAFPWIGALLLATWAWLFYSATCRSDDTT